MAELNPYLIIDGDKKRVVKAQNIGAALSFVTGGRMTAKVPTSKELMTFMADGGLIEEAAARKIDATGLELGNVEKGESDDNRVAEEQSAKK